MQNKINKQETSVQQFKNDIANRWSTSPVIKFSYSKLGMNFVIHNSKIPLILHTLLRSEKRLKWSVIITLKYLVKNNKAP